MRYIINRDFDIIENKDKSVLFNGNVDNVYILNEVETQIFGLFANPCTIDEAYLNFDIMGCSVKVKEEDFCEFIQKLIERRIIILFND